MSGYCYKHRRGYVLMMVDWDEFIYACPECEGVKVGEDIE